MIVRAQRGRLCRQKRGWQLGRKRERHCGNTDCDKPRKAHTSSWTRMPGTLIVQVAGRAGRAIGISQVARWLYAHDKYARTEVGIVGWYGAGQWGRQTLASVDGGTPSNGDGRCRPAWAVGRRPEEIVGAPASVDGVRRRDAAMH